MQIARLHKLLEEKEKRLDEATTARGASLRDSEKCHRELDKSNRELGAALSERASLSERYSELNSYCESNVWKPAIKRC